MKNIEWKVEYEDFGNGDIPVGAESADGRFDIQACYVEGDQPSYFSLIDHETGKAKVVDTIGEGKKAALVIFNAPPPKVWTREELIERAAREWYLNRETKFAVGMARRALAKYGVDVTTFPIPDQVKAAIDAFKASQSK